MVTTAAQTQAGVRLEHLQTLWDHAPHPVWVHQNRILVYVNQAALRVFAAPSAQQMIGRSVLDFVVESSRELVKHRIQAILDNGRAAPMIALTLLRCDGTPFSAQVVAWPIAYHGAPAVQASVHDITAIERTEAALEQSQRDYQQLTELLPQLVWTTRPDGFPDYYNQRWYDYTGVAPGATNGDAWTSVLHPDDIDRGLAVWRAAVESGGQYNVEYRLRRHDGVYRWFLGRANPLRDAQGNISRWFGTCTDIDDQRRTREELIEKEERFRTATLAVSDLLWTNDANGRMHGEQPGWAAFTGQSQEEYQGYGWAAALHPEDAQPTIDAWEAAVAARRMFVFEHRVRRRDGVYRLFAIRALPVLRPDGSVREWVGVHRDVTDRRAQLQEIHRLNTELEERVRQRTAELVASNHELEAFSYSVSHDLRAPLRSIDGFSQALQEDLGPMLSERTQDYLARIRGSVDRMSRLIDALLQLARVTRTEIDKEDVNLSQIAAEAAEQAQRAQPDRIIMLDIQPGLRAHGHARLLHIALANLMGNAFKFTSKTEHPAIQFGAQERDGRREYFVRDNGAGFDMQYARRLFQPFQRLHGDKDFPGTGIGLATVHRAILRHGGTLRAEAAPGRGATFYFTLQ